MNMQMIAAAGLAAPDTMPGVPGKRTPGDGTDAFAALLWMLQAGQVAQVTGVAGDVPAALAGAAAAPLGQMTDAVAAFGGKFAVLERVPQLLGSDPETGPEAAPTSLPLMPVEEGASASAVTAAGTGAQTQPGAYAAKNAAAEGVPLADDEANEARLPLGLDVPTGDEHSAPMEQATGKDPEAYRTEKTRTMQFSIPTADRPSAPAGARHDAVPARDMPASVAQTMPAITAAGVELAGTSSTGTVTSETAAAGVPASPWLQVVRQLERQGPGHLRPGGQTLDLQLHPAELGSVQLRLTYAGGQLAAELHVATAAVKEALEAGLPQLRETLQAQGFDVHGLTVDVRDGGQPNAHDGAPSWQAWAEASRSVGMKPRGDGEPLVAAAPRHYGGSSLLDIRA